ncbi:impaired sucrose induction 1-like protein [Anopheles sinensis]|uniref:Impaired sucrose induction 1-like protein n=1 Tax=Anopheles sinensis TaxID=74873 RepID=A0A084W4M6_ANOSI|nr:impaired sucrose induction 1-like protein [Anopheles sinensis]
MCLTVASIDHSIIRIMEEAHPRRQKRRDTSLQIEGSSFTELIIAHACSEESQPCADVIGKSAAFLGETRAVNHRMIVTNVTSFVPKQEEANLVPLVLVYVRRTRRTRTCLSASQAKRSICLMKLLQPLISQHFAIANMFTFFRERTAPLFLSLAVWLVVISILLLAIMHRKTNRRHYSTQRPPASWQDTARWCSPISPLS